MPPGDPGKKEKDETKPDPKGPDGQDKAPEKEKPAPAQAPAPATRPGGEESRPPEPPQATPPGQGPKLGVDPASSDTSMPPPVPAKDSNPAPLGEADATPPPPVLSPEGSAPKPPDTPPAANDPIPIPEPMPAPSAPAATPDLPPPTPEAKPTPPEINPAPAPNTNPSPMSEPPAITPPAPTVVETPSPAPASPPVESTTPAPMEKPPTFETVPAAPAVEPATTKASTTAALGAGWMVIPSGGRRIVGAASIISTPAEALAEAPRIADGPRVVDDPDSVDQVEPVVHVVRAGENFWTISRLYYHSGRFYKALHAANRRQVPDIRQLYVGTVLRIPPPEALDRALIDPPSRSNTDDPATSPVSRTSGAKRVEPLDEADLAMPARPRRVLPDPEAVAPRRRPTYKVKDHETLRSIARDTLDDPRRDREIYNLNRDVLDDINTRPAAGTTLTLPEDAVIGRRASK